MGARIINSLIMSDTLRGEFDELEAIIPENDQQSSRRRWPVVVGALAVVLLIVPAVAWAFMSAPAHAAPNAIIGEVSYPEAGQIEVVPPEDKCSEAKENCIYSKCCVTSGFQCFEKTPGHGMCMEKCVPGKDGTCLRPSWLIPMRPVVYKPGARSLFCFSAYTANTGSTKKSSELDLLRTQLRYGASIFGCSAWQVYSDVEEWLGPEIFTQKVEDNGDFHAVKRKETGTWVNSPMFVEIWKRIFVEEKWKHADWTVKVDPDAVFLPQRLVDHLSQYSVTENGIYLENCKKVNSGFFGNLEVYSQKAAEIYGANVGSCFETLPWKTGGPDWKYGAWGEDLFAQRCMDKHGVDKVEDFTVTTDGACPADRPEGEKKNKKWKPSCADTTSPAMHPFKKTKDYFSCLSQIMHVDYSR